MGINAYCNLLEEGFAERTHGFTPQEYVFDAFKTIDTVRLVVALLASEDKSEGIPLMVLVRSDVQNTYVPGIARHVIRYTDLADLLEQVSRFDPSTLVQ